VAGPDNAADILDTVLDGLTQAELLAAIALDEIPPAGPRPPAR
jgi:hypothetical protein